MRVRQRIMAILLTVALLLTNTLSVAAAGETTEPVPENTPTATVTVEKVGEGAVLCTGDGITETAESTYSVPVGTVVTVEAQPSEAYTTKQVLFNGSEVEGSFSMPETESTLRVVFEAIPKEEDTEEEPNNDPSPEEQPQEEESVDYVVNSKGIKVKRSLLCEDPNCLEEHVGNTLQVSDLPVTSFVKDASMFGRSARIMEDVYVGMKTSGANAQVAFWGTPGTGGVHEVKILDGGLSGVTGSGYCLNHGAANPGEGFWQVCTYEAVCTAIEGTTATWQVTMTPPDAWDGYSYANGYPAGYQRVGMNVRVGFEEAKGTLEVHKSSSKPELTNGNSNYSLQGAVYGLYQNGVEVARATTNENAVATFQSIKKGDYVLKEITAPKGYALDETSYDVTIISGDTVTKNVTDNPQSDPVAILLGKVDAETNQNKPQGSASLEGAEFTVKYYAIQSDTDPALSGLSPLHTWVLKTDKDGYTRLAEQYKVSGDELYYTLEGDPTLPLGTITIQETKAPKGYLLNPEVFVRQITAEGTGEHVGTYNMPTVPETVQKGVIQLQKKSNETAIGTATLQGAEYEVRNAEGTVVDKLITDANGQAQSKELPLGTYTVKEVKAPAQFLLDPETHTVELTATNTTDRVFYKTVESTETLQKGIIQLQKKSNEASIGNATLKGAEYEVRNAEGILVDTLITDANGQAQSKELPLGTYTVKESKAPTYFLCDRETHTVELTATNTTDRVFYKLVESIETLQKGIIELQKVDSETQKAEAQGSASLKGAVYDIFLKSAYKAGDDVNASSYRQTITTDKNGYAKSTELLLDTYYVIERTASKGYLVDQEIYEVKLTPKNTTDRVFNEKVTSKEAIIRGNVEIIKVSENEDNENDTLQGLKGVEFTFTSDTTGKVVKKIVTDKNGFATTVDDDNPRGGLIYDTYTVTETKCPEGLKPIEPFKVTIEEEGVTLKGIYKEDKLIVSPVSVVKVDASTGKVIPVANTEFRLLDAHKNPVTMTTYYPTKVEHTTFKTDENGQFTFPDKLKYGTYYLEELKAPQGYLKGQLVEFKVTNSANWENPLVVKYADENAMGKITIKKTDKDTGDPISGAVFEIKAVEDIVTPDGTIRVKKGEVVDTVTTEKGTATTKALFIGKYEVVEKKAAAGYVKGDTSYNVELKYKDQNTAIVTETTEITNKPTEIRVLKVDDETEEPLEGVTFKMWNKAMESEIDGEMAVTEELVTDKDGLITVKCLIPGTYCIQEIKTLPGYILNDRIMEVTIDEDGLIDGEESAELVIGNDFTKIDLSKHDLTTDKEIEGGKYQVLDQDENVIDEWTGTKEPHRITKLEVGKTYLFREITAPYGYLLTLDVEFTVKDTGKVQKVKMFDDLAMGKITIKKTDKDTGDPISGAVFEIKAVEDIVTPDGTTRVKKDEVVDTVTTEKGTATTKALFIGKYEVVEKKAAAGYVKGDTSYNVELKYKDQNTAIVTENVDVINAPTTVIINKKEKGSEKSLEGVTYKIWNKAMETESMEMIPEYVTDKDGLITLKYLIPGTYCIQEIKTLPGYVLDKTIYTFVVREDGLVKYDASKEPTGTMTITLDNDYTKLQLSKQDATTGKELPGAKLELIEKETGKVIEEWISGKEPHYIEKLEPGDYILRETLAPKGYLLAEDIVFTVQETGEIQKVVMKDKYSVGGLTPKLPGNGASGNNTSAKTGDITNMMYWLILALLSMGTVSCTMIHNIRRKEGTDEE